MRRFARAALALAVCSGAAAARESNAQVSAGNLFIVQQGNLPFTTPRNRLDVYDRLDLDATLAGFRAGLRYETDRSSDDTPGGGRDAAYGAITQRWAEWTGEPGRLRVGQFETILGRGLLHRSFELPSVVLDEPATRTRYTPARDVDGVLAEGAFGPLAARAFSGRPSDGTVSPASEAAGTPRYLGVLTGGQLEVSLPRDTRVGAAYTRYAYGSAPEREGGSGWLHADPLAALGVRAASLPIHVEVAQQGESFGEWWRFRGDARTPHATYASAGLLWGAYSLTAEWKDYDGFRLGTNDPPSLVREHAPALLNRNTHLLDANGEEGFQLEASAPATAWATLTANLSRADGPPGIRLLRFDERYVEAHVAPPGAEAWEATAFLERGKDTFDFIGDRTLLGVLGSVRVTRRVALGLELERQRALRVPFGALPPESFEDRLLTATVSRAGWGSAALSLERTTDPQQQAFDLFGLPTTSSRTFVGVTVSAALGERSEATLFAGERRGGRACTAGTCYEVLPLEGAELRWTMRY